MPAMLEHTNLTVSNPDTTAAWMCDLFGWHIRWAGNAMEDGRTVHVGTDTHYLALYTQKTAAKGTESSYATIGGLNHIAIVTDDLEQIEKGARTKGFRVGQHHEYEPGRRFYFHDDDNIEFEVVQYD
ncbi:VOC family protein [Tateyamaria omphalii]|uniref:VOC family protein n=1 Tax=Tateyamaria omphalii TaxID=299262 RepID=UPI001C9979CD|nr:VOC family protein [Tateyamaria omphalii]MBY5931612.1 VOC family protein [Tateyamaria omphalii]